MTRAQLVERWRARLEEWRRLGARVDGVAIATEVLADLEALGRGDAGETVSREEAAAILGVHPDSITRWQRQGKIRNVGTRGQPRFLRDELPRPGARVPRRRPAPLAVVAGRGASSADAIVRDVLASRQAL